MERKVKKILHAEQKFLKDDNNYKKDQSECV